MKTSREPASPSQRGESEALLEVRCWKQACYEEVKTMPLREALRFRLKRAAMSARRFQSWNVCKNQSSYMRNN